MKKAFWFLGGALAGAVVGLLVAPQSGQRSRQLIKDKTTRYSHDVTGFVGSKSAHVRNKVKGYTHGVKGLITRRTEPEQVGAATE